MKSLQIELDRYGVKIHLSTKAVEIDIHSVSCETLKASAF